MTEKKKSYYVRLTQDDHRYVKGLALKYGVSMKEIVASMLLYGSNTVELPEEGI